MAQFQISTPDEPSMFAAAQALGLIPASTVYAPGIVGGLTGGEITPTVAWSASIYGAQPTNPGFFGILDLPNEYCLPGDPIPLAQRVFSTNPTTGAVTVTPFVWGPVTITAVPDYSPEVFG